MKTGDLVKIVKNDMSLSYNPAGLKDKLFFDKIGIVIDKYSALRNEAWKSEEWFDIMFDTGIYHVRKDALEILDESRRFGIP
jgi:hypothetical protein